MRPLRPRSSIRLLMVAVTAFAVLLGGGIEVARLRRLSAAYSQKAAAFRRDIMNIRPFIPRLEAIARDSAEIFARNTKDPELVKLVATPGDDDDSRQLAESWKILLREMQAQAQLANDDLLFAKRREARDLTLAEKYERAARRPWLAVAPDPPEPVEPVSILPPMPPLSPFAIAPDPPVPIK